MKQALMSLLEKASDHELRIFYHFLVVLVEATNEEIQKLIGVFEEDLKSERDSPASVAHVEARGMNNPQKTEGAKR